MQLTSSTKFRCSSFFLFIVLLNLFFSFISSLCVTKKKGLQILLFVCEQLKLLLLIHANNKSRLMAKMENAVRFHRVECYIKGLTLDEVGFM